mmetsp:Transcript_4339/g.12285  ORF Transcript_4339/g.12285 Transcript_4339/m.12285 type:complete len:300 (+) Transcript_4339:2442-3341(+)
MVNIDQPDQYAHRQNDLRQRLPKLVKISLERRVVVLIGRLLNLLLNLPNLRLHSRGVHNAHSTPTRDARPRKQHRLLRLQLAVRRRQTVHRLLHRHRLSRQRRLLHPQDGRLQLRHSAVGRNPIPRAHLNHIPRNQPRRPQPRHQPPTTNHLGSLCRHLLERLQRALRIRLLPHAHNRVQSKNQQDHTRLHERPDPQLAVVAPLHERQPERHGRRQQQNLHQRVVKLLQHHRPERRRIRLFQRIRTVLRQTRRRLRLGQPVLQVGPVMCLHVPHRMAPRRVRMHGGGGGGAPCVMRTIR